MLTGRAVASREETGGYLRVAMIMRGIFDGMAGRLGRRVEPVFTRRIPGLPT